MNILIKNALGLAAAVCATQAFAQVTFYENEGFGGRSFTTQQQIDSFRRYGFNDSASSVIVKSNRWEVCEDERFDGRCVILRPGRYPSLAAMGLNDRVSSVRAVGRDVQVDERRYAPAPVVPQVTFYENEGFGGRSFSTGQPIPNFSRFGFNDRASSVVVVGERWEVCDDARFRGRCAVLRPGRYPSLASMGLNNRVSSVRAVAGNVRIEDNRYAPAPIAQHDYRRRQDERTFEASITSVKAVVGTPEQRCWVEPGQVAPQSNVNVPGAVVGAVLGGILGHQIGGGIGKDVATAGGAVAGAAVGANVGRTPGGQAGPDVKRCENVPGSAKADYWDVSYTFRGRDHRVQLSAPPAGPTITVNEQGEPRA